MNNCKSYRQYLALMLGQKQRQRPARAWPQPARKAPRSTDVVYLGTAPRADHGAQAVRGLALALFAADLVVLTVGMIYVMLT